MLEGAHLAGKTPKQQVRPVVGWDGVSVGGRVEGGMMDPRVILMMMDQGVRLQRTMDLAGLEGNLQKDRRDRLPQSPQNLWSPHNLCHLGESPKKGVKAFLFLISFLFYYHQHHDCHCSAHKTPHHHLDSLVKSVLFIMLLSLTSSRKPIPYFLLREEVVIQEARRLQHPL